VAGPDGHAAAAGFRLEVGRHVLALQAREETSEVGPVHATDEVAGTETDSSLSAAV
jgi:hypothetical protein